MKKFVMKSLLVLLLLASPAFASDPLPSWQDTPPKQAIVTFVERMIKEGSSDFVPPAECITTFDNDGTLWTEQPMYTQSYDHNSWQQLIPESCQAYFDGCNNCRRNPANSIAACTRKACATYAKPYCQDDKQDDKATAPETGGKPVAQTITYACEGGKSFTVSYGAYRVGDQRLKLKPDQVRFSDQQNHTARPLNRVRSASGERYSNGKLTLFAKGNEAFVKHQEQLFYANCLKQGQ